MRGLQTLWEGFRVAWDTVSANRVRSGLTVLGVAVGVSVVMAIAALISGIRSSIVEGFEAAGPRNFSVVRIDFTAVTLGDDGPPPWAGRPEITPEEAQAIASLPAVSEALYNLSFGLILETEGRRVEGVTGVGYSAGWPRYSLGDFTAGRDFTPAEVRQSRAVVVLSANLAEEAFGQRDPVGRRVGLETPYRAGQQEFTVIGVFRPQQSVFGGALRNWAVVPYSSALKRLKAPDFQAGVAVVPEDSVSMGEAEDQVVGLLRGLRGLGPREENDFSLLESAQILELFDRLTGIFFLVMLAL
ncbi:MAG TPA: ABC transporter permease, partial [Longimicrobiales bacterium]|nr:ABC transporter permease [Longimicrobiales bacterium]